MASDHDVASMIHATLCVGVPEPRPDHCKALTLLALSLHDILDQALDSRPDLPRVRCRMGLQSGSVVGGVIGVKHPRYRLFGDIVNTAARMETRSEPGRLHVAEAAAAILRETGMFSLTDRGEMTVKGKGVMRTCFVDGLAADVVEPGALMSALERAGSSETCPRGAGQMPGASLYTRKLSQGLSQSLSQAHIARHITDAFLD
jgi:class 3 adenylate cyclase